MQAQINFGGACIYVAQVRSALARDAFKEIGPLLSSLSPQPTTEDVKRFAKEISADFKSTREMLKQLPGKTLDVEALDRDAARAVVDRFKSKLALDDAVGIAHPQLPAAPGPASSQAAMDNDVYEPLPVVHYGIPLETVDPDPFAPTVVADPNGAVLPSGATLDGGQQLAAANETSAHVMHDEAERPTDVKTRDVPARLVWLFELVDEPLELLEAQSTADLDELRMYMCDAIAGKFKGFGSQLDMLADMNPECVVVKRVFAPKLAGRTKPSYDILAISIDKLLQEAGVAAFHDQAWAKFLRLKVAKKAGLCGLPYQEYVSRVQVKLFSAPKYEHVCGVGLADRAGFQTGEEADGVCGTGEEIDGARCANGPAASSAACVIDSHAGGGNGSGLDACGPVEPDLVSGLCALPGYAGATPSADGEDENILRGYSIDEIIALFHCGFESARVKVALMVENDDYLQYARDHLPTLAADLACICEKEALSVELLGLSSAGIAHAELADSVALHVSIGLQATHAMLHRGPLTDMAEAAEPGIRDLFAKCLGEHVRDADIRIMYHCAGCVIVILEMPVLVAKILTGLIDAGHLPLVAELKISCAALIEAADDDPLAIVSFFGGGPVKAERARREMELVETWWTWAQAACDSDKQGKVAADAAGPLLPEPEQCRQPSQQKQQHRQEGAPGSEPSPQLHDIVCLCGLLTNGLLARVVKGRAHKKREREWEEWRSIEGEAAPEVELLGSVPASVTQLQQAGVYRPGPNEVRAPTRDDVLRAMRAGQVTEAFVRASSLAHLLDFAPMAQPQQQALPPAGSGAAAKAACSGDDDAQGAAVQEATQLSEMQAWAFRQSSLGTLETEAEEMEEGNEGGEAGV